MNSGIPTLHIFNPDTDYALASGLDFYTPPASVLQLRRSMSLFPASYASPGDAILSLDPLPDSTDLPPEMRIFVPIHHQDHRGKMLTEYFDIHDNLPLTQWIDSLQEDGHINNRPLIRPWGWNPSLRRHLLSAGVPEELLPSADNIARLRHLSHRATTIPFNRMMCGIKGCDAHIPVQLFSAQEAVDFHAAHSDCYLKAPWSSSGRGVIRCHDLEERHIRPWTAGIIRRQGSVLAEVTAQRTLDFATEWWCGNQEIRFIGYSVFRTSPRGKYLGNLPLTQQRLLSEIKKAAPLWNDSILLAQHQAIATLIAPSYNGPLGIDMAALSDGRIRPCIEINLRTTMGMVSISQQEHLSVRTSSVLDTDAAPATP